MERERTELRRQRSQERTERRERTTEQDKPAAQKVFAVLGEVLAIGQEMVRIPYGIWMRVAERAGALTLAAWRFLWPLLIAAWKALGALVRWAERVVTPTRAAAAVLFVAIGVLVVSQFIDYTETRAGVPAYAGVKDIAPAPQVSSDPTHDAHSWVVLALAAAALVILVLSLRGRWRLARMLVPIGLAVILISVFIDRPAGLDEGAAADLYEGAEASLLAGFWTQLVAGVVITLVAPILSVGLAAGRRVPKARRARRARVRRPRLKRTPASRVEGAGT
jgi:hypothetical protein